MACNNFKCRSEFVKLKNQMDSTEKKYQKLLATLNLNYFNTKPEKLIEILNKYEKQQFEDDEDEKEYNCESCGKSFWVQDDLESHTCENYNCDVCGKEFSNQKELQNHITDIHKTKNLLENVCDQFIWLQQQDVDFEDIFVKKSSNKAEIPWLQNEIPNTIPNSKFQIR